VKVLQVAFACNPEGHGEHWLGWAWVEQAKALGADVHVVAFPKDREQVLKGAANLGVSPHFVDVWRWFDILCERSGMVGSWTRMMWWQRRLLPFVRALHEREHFNIIHQTTYHTFRIPFRAAMALDIPAVWGPMAGGENVPKGFERYLGHARMAETLRPALNKIWLRSPAVQSALRRADALMVSNQTTLSYLPEFCREKSVIVPPNALREIPSPPDPTRRSHSVLRLFFAGNCVGTRVLPLVMSAMREVAADCPTVLTIAGKGPALEYWKCEAARLGVQVKFTGHVNRSELGELYAAADVFVFPALRDSGGSGLLEAMSLGLPVICVDWGGPAEMVDQNTGIKLPVSDPAQMVRNFADQFRRLGRDPELARRIGQAGAIRARTEYTWDKKRKVLGTIYETAQARHRNRNSRI
jgi:glycosyltransferase involved in cell wall biosynthesis